MNMVIKALETDVSTSLNDDWAFPAKLMGAVVIAFFGVGGIWAATARLDQAAVAPGIVLAEGNRKTVQHLEGGIIDTILVRDGDLVQQDQILIRLRSTVARASSQVSKTQLIVAVAQEARLIAEQQDASTLIFPDEVMALSSEPAVFKALGDQTAQFKDRRANIAGQLEIFHSKIKQLQEQKNGLSKQKLAGESQVEKIDSELVGLRELAAKNLIPLSRLYSLEREKARLVGDVGRLEAEIARSNQSVDETMLQIEQVRKQFQESISRELAEVRKIVSEQRERSTVTSDVLDRVDIRAPVTGTVQGLKFFTNGGIVRPGDTLLEIAPRSPDILIKAQISPMDIDSIRVGDTAEIRFPAFSTRQPPIFLGSVKTLSRDRLIDDANKSPYYSADVTIGYTDIPSYFSSRIIPGMQADIIVALGERTVLQYLIGPLRERLKKSMREH